jgi:hypothetical protein
VFIPTNSPFGAKTYAVWQRLQTPGSRLRELFFLKPGVWSLEPRQPSWFRLRRLGTAAVGLSLVALTYVLALAPSLASTTVDWRESDVLVVGRNLCRKECSLWLPRINAAGDGESITGMEFPILNRLGALSSCGGARQVLASRLWTLLFALVGITSLALLAHRHLSGHGAAVAVIGFAFSPIVLFYGRAVQPDVPSAALALLSVLLLDLALTPRATRWGLWFASAAVMALGALIKLPAVVYGLPLAALTWTRRGSGALRDVRYWLFVPLSLGPALVWYSHARALQTTYGIHYFNLGSSWESLLADWTSARFYQRIFARQLFDVYACPLVSAVGVISLLSKSRRMPSWIPSMALAALAFLFLGGWVAAWHNSYGVMVTPPLSLAAGWGSQHLLGRVRHGFARGALAIGLWAAIAGYGLHRSHRWLARPEEAPLFMAAKQRLDEHLTDRDLVVVISDGDPKALWYLDRKGFVLSEKEEDWLRLARPQVAQAVLVDKTRVLRAAGRSEAVRAALVGQGYLSALENEAAQLWLKRPSAVDSAP